MIKKLGALVLLTGAVVTGTSSAAAQATPLPGLLVDAALRATAGLPRIQAETPASLSYRHGHARHSDTDF
ncbi:hypothetical protein [Streptomyces sp. NPDC003077]|uniref:hypothetical protein n=1 Tax=Streptomyces sp. NPDC003077 TaxID=3154443 RepID=UPI0033B0726F